MLGNKNIFKVAFYGYQNILYWFFIPVIYIVISNMIIKRKYYSIFVLFWEKGIVYTLTELVYFMLSNDRMHAEGADWVRRYCTGISICTCTEIHTWACLYTCTTVYLENTPYTRLKSIPGKLLRFSKFFISPEINLRYTGVYIFPSDILNLFKSWMTKLKRNNKGVHSLSV